MSAPTTEPKPLTPAERIAKMFDDAEVKYSPAPQPNDKLPTFKSKFE